MADIIDKLILFLLNSCFIFTCFPSKASITYFLVALIFSCFCTYVEDSKIKVAFFFIFIGISCFQPILLYYLPIMVYDIFSANIQAILLLILKQHPHIMQSEVLPTHSIP